MPQSEVCHCTVDSVNNLLQYCIPYNFVFGLQLYTDFQNGVESGCHADVKGLVYHDYYLYYLLMLLLLMLLLLSRFSNRKNYLELYRLYR